MNITQLRCQAEAIVQSELGAEFSGLPFQFDIEMNESRSLANGFAVTWGSGNQVYNIDQRVNIEQDLRVSITKRVFVRNNDDKIVSETDGVYSALGNIIKRFVMDRLDCSDIVQTVELSSLGEPERIGNGRDIVLITLVFRVKYIIE